MECFRADFLEFFTKNYKISLFGWRLGTRQQIPEFQKFSWNFVISCEMLKRLVLAVFFQETSKFGYLADGWELAIKSKHFRNFLETSYFRVEFYRADFFHFFTKKRQNLAIGLTAVNSLSNRSILGIFLKFPNFLWNVLELIFFNFLPKNDKLWH